jgi:DNA-binding transcriptional LysR family regulator
LRITPPALSNQLKDLESNVGGPLTRRSDGKVIITALGEIVLSYADKMFSTYEDLIAKLSNSHNRNKCFRVGISQNIAARFSFDLLLLLKISNLSQSEKVSITFDAAERLHTAFLNEQFDLIIGAFPSQQMEEVPLPISHPFIFPVRLFAHQSIMVTPGATTKDLAQMTPHEIIEHANSRKIALVIPMSNSVLRTETDQFLSELKTRPLRTIECNTSSGIVMLIEQGSAIGFVPTPCLLDFKSAHELTVLGPSKGYWSHAISVLVQKSKEISVVRPADLLEIFSPSPQCN